MENTSEYQIPIFISSTHYNLIDFRAELCRFLGEIGYRPILSSSEGFPDSAPKLEPWESCLRVLDNSFLMILVIDGRYGERLSWPNFEDILGKEDVSPTHAEYRFAQKTRKRILVFIRRELMTHYQSFRKICKQYKLESKRRRELEKTLPDYVDFDTLKFIKEVKTSKPIPWIKEFDDVTQVKREIQRKMINELAEVFLMKEKKIETVVEIFNKAMDELSPDKQKEFMKKVNITKEITKENEGLKKLNNELKKAKKERKTAKVKELEKEIDKLKNETTKANIADSPLFLNDQGNVRISGSTLGYSGIGLVGGPYYTSNFLWTKKCGKCDKDVPDDHLGTNLKKCYSCYRDLCTTCWPEPDRLVNIECPDCRKNSISGLTGTIVTR